MGGQRHAQALLLQRKTVPIVQKAGWAPELVWMGAENFAPTGFRTPDRPALSESLYRLSYPGPCSYVFNKLSMHLTFFAFVFFSIS